MKLFQSEDPDRPIETYQGYLGLYHDGSVSYEPELSALERIDFNKYRRLLDEMGETRHLQLELPSGTLTLVIDGDQAVGDILDQLPTVDVYIDGPFLLFFAAEGVAAGELVVSIAALTAAVEADLSRLEKMA
jgi:hypothetical protein